MFEESKDFKASVEEFFAIFKDSSGHKELYKELLPQFERGFREEYEKYWKLFDGLQKGKRQQEIRSDFFYKTVMRAFDETRGTLLKILQEGKKLDKKQESYLIGVSFGKFFSAIDFGISNENFRLDDHQVELNNALDNMMSSVLGIRSDLESIRKNLDFKFIRIRIAKISDRYMSREKKVLIANIARKFA